MSADRLTGERYFADALHAMLKSNGIDCHASRQRMLGMQADLLCEGHFGVIRGREAVTRFIETYLP